jgi:hypothetical protein
MAISLTDYNSLSRLCAIGNNEFWHEDLNMAAGEMVELVAANGDIDTTDQLVMFSGFQKAFIVNGKNLKIADFGNVKLTHTALATPMAFGEVITQSQGGGDYAYMVVNFTNAAKTQTYGYAYYAGSATAFDTSAVVTGTGTDFTPTAVTDPPHWYDWTSYAGTAGSLPNKAYLGCLYNGRAVLSGDPEHPNQWYMPRQANPFDWTYIQGDPGSPVKGGNSDLGELGDIVRCLAPYKDDYLIFGCSNSVWVMFGDAMAGGSIREVSLTTGIFGANSFCWDDSNNFYFWGNNGLYRTTIPGVPQCISQYKLPRIVKDEAASPQTHRITLMYDSDRHGILVAITLLASGANSNYFYDLNAVDENTVGGFFPETYPTECGIFSGIYYDSNDPELKGLVVGCTDGYIRYFDDGAKNDIIGPGNESTINSSVSLGPVHISGLAQREGTVGGLDITTAGGKIGGSQADSDNVDFKIFTSRTAANILEKMKAGVNPNFAGTFVGPGDLRGSTRRQTARGVYLGVKLENTTAGESWGFEDVFVNLKASGRKK